MFRKEYGGQDLGRDDYYDDFEEDGLDIKAILATVRRRFRVIFGFAFLVLGLVTATTLSQTPLYTASSQILLEQNDDQLVGLEALISGAPIDSTAVDTEVQLLVSRGVLGAVVDRLDLTEDSEFNPPPVAPTIFTYLNPKSWLGALKKGKESTPDLALLPGEELGSPEREKAIRALRDRVDVSRSGRTHLLNVAFTSESPRKAARIANAISEAYIDQQVQGKVDAVVRANEWLSRRAEELRVELEVAESRAAEYRAQAGLTDTGGSTLNEQQLSEINAQLIIARSDLAGRQVRLERVRALVREGGDVSVVAEALDSPTIASLRMEQAEVVRRRAELDSQLGAKHPTMIKVDQELRDVEAQIRAEVDRIIASLTNEVSIVRERVRSLERSLRRLEVENSSNNQDLVRLRQLQREAEAKRALYEAFLSRSMETYEASQLEEADARIVTVAEVPSTRSSPMVARSLIQALVLGGALGVGIAFGIEFFDRGLRTTGEIERATSLPVLASVPSMAKSDLKLKKNLVQSERLELYDIITKKPLSPFAEAWRNLSAAVTMSDVDSPPKSVVITSSLPGEGKTTSSLCFARDLARSGKRVVLVDCDLRKATLTGALKNMKWFRRQMKEGTAKLQGGLVEVMTHEVNIEDVLVADPEENLVYLPLVKKPSNPSAILTSQSFKILLQELREEFDFVVIDSAPTLPVVDTKILSRLVDSTVFVVRWQETPKEAVQSALRELTRGGASVPGVLLTQVDMKKQRLYGYSDGGYYYGDQGYGDDG